jgi:hypothetical protein
MATRTAGAAMPVMRCEPGVLVVMMMMVVVVMWMVVWHDRFLIS